jgi:hypothetical protein
MTPYLFTNENLTPLLKELANLLATRGFRGKIQIVGGAAISISVNPNRDATLDVDAKWRDSQIVTDVIADLAVSKNLPNGWLNQEFTKFSPPVHNGDWLPLIDVDGVVIEIATPEFLLAMKLFADRGFRDRQDIVALLAQLGIPNPDAAEAVFERYWPGEGLRPPTRAFLEAHFAQPRE